MLWWGESVKTDFLLYYDRKCAGEGKERNNFQVRKTGWEKNQNGFSGCVLKVGQKIQA